MKNIDIDQLLQPFVGCDEQRPQLLQPWRDGDYICASDVRIMIRVNGALSDKDYNKKHFAPSCAPWDATITGHIPTDAIAAAIDKCPLVDEMKTEGKDVECPECGGSGEVEWEYKRWTEYFGCPRCHGDRYIENSREIPTGRKILSYEATVKISGYHFPAVYIELIHNAAVFTGTDSIGIAAPANPGIPMLFRLSDDISIILMSVSNGDNQCYATLHPTKD